MLSNTFKVYYLVAIYFLFSTFTLAQVNWNWLNPKPMGYTINGATVIPGSSTFIAVGAKGVITKTTNSGTSWTLLRSGYLQALNSVSFPTSTVGYAVGDTAVVLKTTDGGETWNAVSSPLDAGNLTKVQFISSTVGFVNDKTGPKIHKTTDGGLSWITFVTSYHGDINSFEMVDADNGFYLAKEGYIFKISSGVSSIVCTTVVAPLAIDFYDANSGIVVGNSVTYVTSDGGNNWSSPLDGCPIIPNAVSYSGPSKIIAISSAEEIILSTNGGTNWSSIVAATSNLGLSSIVFLDQDNGLVLGTTGMTYTTANGGSTWTRTTTPTLPDFNQLNSITSFDRATIWAAGSGGKILKSTDGGTSWSASSFPVTSTINCIRFISDQIGHAVVSNALYATANGGTSWTAQTLGVTPSQSQEVAFSSVTRGYFCTALGVIRITNNGSTWAAPSSTPSGNWYGIATTTDEQITYICGVSGSDSKIIKTINGGVNWTTLPIAIPSTIFYSIRFITTTTGWAVGTGGNVYKTTDGGGSWSKQASSTTSTLQSVDFFDENHGIAVGNDGTIIKTTDGGTTWERASEVTDQPLMSTLLLNEYSAIAVGSGSVILKSSNAPLPVELVGFTATHKYGTISLNWQTATEIDNYGFEIERKSSATGWQKIGFVEGHFTTNSPKYYNFTDRPTGTGKIQYRLKQIDNDGSFEYSPVVEVDLSGMLPREIEIKNFPNPFNPETNINITIPENADATVDVYNSTGEKVATLFTGKLNSSETRAFKFDGTDLPSGMYIINVTAGKHHKSHKVMLMK
ncbi:MAG: hypothetical protein HBSAPP04_17220 [Ignavibacteriaceae bacterium]|nr:MAG: hypothetical protein HBSAPP04_17220 [Ignavibacteriaceae bacterium]